MLCCGGCFFGEVASGFFLPASCCFARARGAPASRSPAAWMPVDIMLAPAEDQFWTDMHEGQMKLKIRVRRMKESRDMRGLSAGRLLSFRWGRRGKRGDTQPVPASPGGRRAADGERSAMAGHTKRAGGRRAGTWRRSASVWRGREHARPATGDGLEPFGRQLEASRMRAPCPGAARCCSMGTGAGSVPRHLLGRAHRGCCILIPGGWHRCEGSARGRGWARAERCARSN